jgi:hypothetical protein
LATVPPREAANKSGGLVVLVPLTLFSPILAYRQAKSQPHSENNFLACQTASGYGNLGAMIAAMLRLKTTKEVAKICGCTHSYIRILCAEDKTLGEVFGGVRFLGSRDIARIKARMATRKNSKKAAAVK